MALQIAGLSVALLEIKDRRGRPRSRMGPEPVGAHQRAGGAAARAQHDRRIGTMAEIKPIPLALVDALAITMLVDNVTDILLLDDGPALRPPLGSGPRLPAPILEGGEAFDALRAEHGFAALVTATRAGQEHRLLFDTGITPDGLVENMRRLELSPRDVEAIVLSHGHFDHVGGMQGLVRELGTANLPLFLHPDARNKRRIAL